MRVGPVALLGEEALSGNGILGKRVHEVAGPPDAGGVYPGAVAPEDVADVGRHEKAPAVNNPVVSINLRAVDIESPGTLPG